MHDDDLFLLFYDSVGPLVAGLLYIHIHTHMHVCTNMTRNARRGVADSRGESWSYGETGVILQKKVYASYFAYLIHCHKNSKQNHDTAYPPNVTLHLAGTCVMSLFPCTSTSAGYVNF